MRIDNVVFSPKLYKNMFKTILIQQPEIIETNFFCENNWNSSRQFPKNLAFAFARTIRLIDKPELTYNLLYLLSLFRWWLFPRNGYSRLAFSNYWTPNLLSSAIALPFTIEIRISKMNTVLHPILSRVHKHWHSCGPPPLLTQIFI